HADVASLHSILHPVVERQDSVPLSLPPPLIHEGLDERGVLVGQVANLRKVVRERVKLPTVFVVIGTGNMMSDYLPAVLHKAAVAGCLEVLGAFRRRNARILQRSNE